MKEIRLSIEGLSISLAPVLKGNWLIKQASLCGDICEMEMDWAAGLPDSLSLNLPREEDILILLYPPRFDEKCRIHPLGVFIPSYETQGELSFIHGSAVSILFTLIENNLNIHDFNCSRFLSEMARLQDPWLVEEHTLLKQLGRREMRSWYIRNKTLFEIEIPLSRGWWFGPSLLQDPYHSAGPDEINMVSVKLPEGYSFLMSPAKQEIVEIQVDSHGEAVWIITPLPPAASM